MSYIGNLPTTAAFPFDQFSGNASTTAFTLTYAPAGTTSILVSVSGVTQNPNTYGVIGTTLTFTGAPPTGTNNIAVLYLGMPVIGVSSPGNTAYRTPQDFTATASQTTFTTAGSYTVGFLEVYRNGARLGDADFTATNGTTVVLGTACTAGDLVTIVYFTLTSIVNAVPQSGGSFTGNISVPTGTLYPLVSGTAQATTSGTFKDFTDIPSWVKRITVMFSGVSLNATSSFLIQLGTSSGVVSTGYISTSESLSGGVGSGSLASTSGMVILQGAAVGVTSGTLTLALISGNAWVSSHVMKGGTTYAIFGGGDVTLAGVLDRIRITTVNGTDVFDAGSVNILWE